RPRARRLAVRRLVARARRPGGDVRDRRAPGPRPQAGEERAAAVRGPVRRRAAALRRADGHVPALRPLRRLGPRLARGGSRVIGRGRWARGAAALALLGATLGAALDGLHTHFGKTAYTHPVVWRMAWWVPLLFAGAFSLGLARPLLERLLGAAGPMPSRGGVAAAFGAFVVAYVVSVLPLPWPVVAGMILVLFALSWWLFDRSPAGLAVALAASFGGPAV